MSVFCIWNKHVNRIRERKKPQEKTAGGFEINFPTWEEAQAFLIAEREKEVAAAQRELKSAERRLKAARAMRP